MTWELIPVVGLLVAIWWELYQMRKLQASTVTETKPVPAAAEFTQLVVDEMYKVFDETGKFIGLRHGDHPDMSNLPEGYRVERH